MTDHEDALLQKIASRQIRVGIVGLGHVGLPLAVAFAEEGLRVSGIDIDASKVKRIAAGESYVGDVSAERVARLVAEGSLSATTDYGVLKDIDAVIICVPTPLSKTRDPDISHIIYAADEIVRHFHPGQLIVLESTTYPGTTEEIILPRLEEKGYRVAQDFSLAFSAERIDPGNEVYGIQNTPKVIGGITPGCLRVATTLYELIVGAMVPVSDTKTAEMVKLLENTFRAVNIGLINEVALMCDRLDIDVWEVIEAASTKPYGFMTFLPGPGLGGHCIPLDPYYLAWKLRTLNYTARFVELAGDINSSMPFHVVSMVESALNDQRQSVNGARILILGAAYKPDVADVRESPAIDILEVLHRKGALLYYHDPLIAHLDLGDFSLSSSELTDPLLSAMDCVVIVTPHSIYDWQNIVQHATLVIDTRNATGPLGNNNAKVTKL
jgi:UDP-N-acetyl-D-glucosamine dehydrogenase